MLQLEEWERIRPLGFPPPLPCAGPAEVVVIEDDAGAVIGSLGVMAVTHIEGAQIVPEHRGDAGVMRALLDRAGEVARARGETWVMAGAADDDEAMRGYLGRLDGNEIPARFFAVAVEGEGGLCLRR